MAGVHDHHSCFGKLFDTDDQVFSSSPVANDSFRTNKSFSLFSLYHLSKLSACKGKECQKLDLKGKLRHIFIHFLRLTSVNCAYLVIRVYVSQRYDKALTIFIIKNVLCVVMSARSLFIEINEYFSLKKHLSLGNEKRNGEHTHHVAFELQNFSANVGDKLVQNGSNGALVDKDSAVPNADNFEDIALK